VYLTFSPQGIKNLFFGKEKQIFERKKKRYTRVLTQEINSLHV
jgi:hypothetical protein